MRTQTSPPRYALTVGELSQLLGETATALRDRLAQEGFAAKSAASRVPPEQVRDVLARCGVDYRFRVVACVNLRGGIGKTTCATTLASRAAQYGFRTVLLDLDAQGSASLAFDRAPAEDQPIFYDVWQKPAEMVPAALVPIDAALYLLPSALENGLLDVSLLNPAAQKKAVRGVCQEIERQGFDLVVIDCPPSLGAAVISTICAADILVIPLWSDTFSFKGLELTLQEVRSICETFQLREPAVKLLYSRHDQREKLAARALERLRTDYRDLFVPVVVPTSTEFSQALAKSETIFAARRSTPARTAYDHFLRNLLDIHMPLRSQGDPEGGNDGEG